MLSPEQKQVVQAIEQLKLVVTPADIVDRTGLPINSVAREISQIAFETGAKLEITKEGRVVYHFTPGFHNAYLAQGQLKLFNEFIAASLSALYFLFQIAVIALAVIPCLLMGDRMLLASLFFLGYLVIYQITKKPEERHILTDFIHYIFGEQNPNHDLDDRKWRLLAHEIDINDNKLTVEQMAPFTGLDPKSEESALPVLARFGGVPEVTETGNIIYSFPTLQETSKEKKEYGDFKLDTVTSTFSPTPLGELVRRFLKIHHHGTSSLIDIGRTDYLVERPWTLCDASSQRMEIMATIICLGFIAATGILIAASKFAFIGLLNIQILFACVTFLFLFPTLRSWLNIPLNDTVKGRNKQRLQYAEQVMLPGPTLKNKLEEAKQYAVKDKNILKDDVIYTTEKDSLEQKFDT